MATKVRHWKHGWIPVSPEAKALVAARQSRSSNRYHPSDRSKVWSEPGPRGTPMAHTRVAVTPSKPRPVVVPKSAIKAMPDLQKEIERNGGFTFDPKTGGLLKVGEAKGFAVAVPGTEEVVGVEKVGADDITREDFARGIAKVVLKHRDKIDKGAVLGGWYSPERNEYMVELTQIHPADDREGAIAAGKAQNQEAIFDLGTGETIVTGGTGDAGAVRDPSVNAPLSTFVAKLTPEESAAAKYYTGPGYKPLNGSLRFGEPMHPAVQHYMQQLDSAVNKSVLDRDVTVYRGVQPGSWLPNGMAPGTVIEDRGYMSTAADESGQYGGQVKMVIRVPKGAHALDLNGQALTHHPNEAEVLLPRDTKLKVISDVAAADGTRTITAEVAT